MKSALKESEIVKLLEKVPAAPLELKVENSAVSSDDDKSKSVLNIILSLKWKNFSGRFAGEVVRQATPRSFQEAVRRIKNWNTKVKSQKNNLNPIIIAPYLSEEALEQLLEMEISGIDLSGNAAIIIPNKVFIYKAGGKNKYPASAPIKNVFSGISSSVARVFLLKQEYESVGDIVKEIAERGLTVSFPTVSKVLKALEEELIISRKDNIHLIDGEKLLKNLRNNYRSPVSYTGIKMKVSDLPAVLETIRQNAERENILYARNEPSKYTVMPSGGAPIKIYTESVERVTRGVEGAETNRFPNIEILEVRDSLVYFDRRRDEEAVWLSPLEVYLELANGGKREKDSAGEWVSGLLNAKY